jgi:transcriptional regulator with XRE-family HTH domain
LCQVFDTINIVFAKLRFSCIIALVSATLGGLIKDLRIQKNISQLEIAFSLGWKEPTRLSRIEQGKVAKPPRELIDKLLEAMRLSNEEKYQVLVTGNYLPTEEEVRLAKAKIKPLVDAWEFPSVAIDYTWRIIYANKQLCDVFNVAPQHLKVIEEKLPSLVEIVFEPNFNEGTLSSNTSEDRKRFLLRFLKHFKYAQQARSREKWYEDLVKKMMNNDIFRELWPAARIQNFEAYEVCNATGKDIFLTRADEQVHLQFHSFLMPIFGDPRFLVELSTPMSSETFDYFVSK